MATNFWTIFRHRNGILRFDLACDGKLHADTLLESLNGAKLSLGIVDSIFEIPLPIAKSIGNGPTRKRPGYRSDTKCKPWRLSSGAKYSR